MHRGFCNRRASAGDWRVFPRPSRTCSWPNRPTIAGEYSAEGQVASTGRRKHRPVAEGECPAVKRPKWSYSLEHYVQFYIHVLVLNSYDYLSKSYHCLLPYNVKRKQLLKMIFLVNEQDVSVIYIGINAEYHYILILNIFQQDDCFCSSQNPMEGEYALCNLKSIIFVRHLGQIISDCFLFSQ